MLAGMAFTQSGAGLGPVTLKLGGKVGQSSEYTMTMNMSMKLSSADGVQNTKMDSEMLIEKKILDIDKNIIKSETVIKKSKVLKEGVEVPTQIDGQVTIIEQNRNGKILKQEVIGSKQQSSFKAPSTVFPEKPINIGAVWSGKEELPQQMFMKYKNKLINIEKKRGKLIATIEIDLSINSSHPMLKASGKGKGMLYFNVDDGDIEKSTMKMKMNVNIPGPDGKDIVNETVMKMTMKKLKNMREKSLR